MSKLIFEDLEREDRKDTTCFSFRMRLKNGKNYKYRHVCVFKITNETHEYFGQWVIMSYGKANLYFTDKKTAILTAKKYLKILKQELEQGLVNWWTGKKIGDFE